MRDDVVEMRRAIEALRAGVPNRDVVRHIEPHQEDILDRFDHVLEAAQAGWPDGKPSVGMLIEGDFGTGKSHWLEYFRHVALQGNFICSTVVLNKETSLHDLARVCTACVESAVAPGKVGPALPEITHTYDARTAPYYQDFFEWVHRAPGLDPRYGATLLLFERTRDPDVRRQVVEEWTGNPMRVPDLRAALKEIGERGTYDVSRPHKGEVLQRFRFLSHFFRSAGYGGWVILVDEAEMISRYSLKQRGRAYAHLAQLLGLVKEAAVPGLAAVFTITKDYAGQVLYGRKNDAQNIPARMQGSKFEEYIIPAEIGMKAIRSRGIDLHPPTRDQVVEIYQTVRSLYSRAYDWPAPEIENRREYSSTTSMRQHIRSWITTWDLRRLYNYEAQLVAETVTQSYDEDRDLQQEGDGSRSWDESGASSAGEEEPVRVL